MPIPNINFTIVDGALGSIPANNSKVCVKMGICSKATASVAASVLIPSTTMSDGVTFTAATAGAAGNGISVTYTTGASASPVVTVNNLAITVQIKSGTSTNANVVSAIAGSTSASALVTAVATGGSDLATAASQTFLAGGSTGTINSVFSETNPTQAVTDLGYGPLTEAVCHALNIAGGQCYAMPLNPSVAGSNTAVVHTGSGSPVVTVSGTPNDSYSFIVYVTLGGALGVGQFQYSQDGGNTKSAVFLIPSGGTYVVPNTGLTVTFGSGTYVLADTYAFTSTAPGFTTTDVQNAFAALSTAGVQFGFVHLVGPASSVSGSASMAAALETLALAQAATYFRFIHVDMECAQDTDANILSAFASTTCTRVDVCAGQEVVQSSIPGSGDLTRNIGFSAAAREALVPEANDLGRVLDGPLPGVLSLNRNEALTPNLDAANFTTARTIVGQTGFFITTGHMFETAGSDYALSQNRRVMDLACTVAFAALTPFLNDTILVNSNGTIANPDATKIENQVNGQLQAAVVAPRQAVASSVVVDRTNNVLSTKTLNVTVRITPYGYAKTITCNIGFANPNLQLVA